MAGSIDKKRAKIAERMEAMASSKKTPREMLAVLKQQTQAIHADAEADRKAAQAEAHSTLPHPTAYNVINR